MKIDNTSFQLFPVMSSYYIKHSALDRSLNVPIHFNQIASTVGNIAGQFVINDLLALKKQIENNTANWLYFIAHSDKNKGMCIGNNVNIDGELLSEIFPAQKHRIPELIFFNTCFGEQSGLVEAALKAGVRYVIATSQAIPITGMSNNIMMFLNNWKKQQRPAIPGNYDNLQFMCRNIEFSVFNMKTYG